MPSTMSKAGLTRRALLKSCVAMGASFAVGTNFVAAGNAAWALEVTHLKPATLATLIQMARDIYPHDHLADEYYALAIRGYDDASHADRIEAGIAELNAAARGLGFPSYLETPWERNRVEILRGFERSEFFQTVRGGLVTGLYNQKAVWPMFGYEGESYSKGGYIHRGFNDINWL